MFEREDGIFQLRGGTLSRFATASIAIMKNGDEVYLFEKGNLNRMQ